MQPVSFEELIRSKLEAGEELIPISKIPALKKIPNTTRVEWCRKGRLPVTQIEGRYYSFISLINAAIAAMSINPQAKPISRRSPSKDLERVKALARK